MTDAASPIRILVVEDEAKLAANIQRGLTELGFAVETAADGESGLKRVREVAYDLVFDTQGLIKTGLVMRMARLAPGGRRIGLANGTEGSGYEALSRLFHTESIAVGCRTHAVARARLVAAGGLGRVAESAADFMLSPPEVSARAAQWLPPVPYAVFFHGTARAAKQWPPASWIAVGRQLAARGMPVLLAWGSAEEKRAAASLAAQIDGAVVLPSLPMMDAVLLAQRAALVVGVDTGLTHIAAAYCRPTVELYCDSPRWKTEGNWSAQIINLGDRGAPPSVAAVLAAIDTLLADPAVDLASAPVAAEDAAADTADDAADDAAADAAAAVTATRQ